MNSTELFDILQRKAATLKPEASLTATILFELTGDDGALWRGRVEGGRAELAAGAPADPDITVTAATETAVGLFQKTVNPVAAFMAGKIKVKGDVRLIGLIKDLLSGSPRD
ncbi:MAG: SCP2 sterol-binding domain-containing protein [Candidatus Adiutrix sp.]|nr:SCP2 sterol-binding domain-containing protein [Candidatus Adiutrix sp.]